MGPIWVCPYCCLVLFERSYCVCFITLGGQKVKEILGQTLTSKCSKSLKTTAMDTGFLLSIVTPSDYLVLYPVIPGTSLGAFASWKSSLAPNIAVLHVRTIPLLTQRSHLPDWLLCTLGVLAKVWNRTGAITCTLGLCLSPSPSVI